VSEEFLIRDGKSVNGLLSAREKITGAGEDDSQEVSDPKGVTERTQPSDLGCNGGSGPGIRGRLAGGPGHWDLAEYNCPWDTGNP
jgi:hypothetical protein